MPPKTPSRRGRSKSPAPAKSPSRGKSPASKKAATQAESTTPKRRTKRTPQASPERSLSPPSKPAPTPRTRKGTTTTSDEAILGMPVADLKQATMALICMVLFPIASVATSPQMSWISPQWWYWAIPVLSAFAVGSWSTCNTSIMSMAMIMVSVLYWMGTRFV